MRIIVDCFGGDNCPQAPVEGAILALKESKNLVVALCGDEDKIKAELAKYEYDKNRVEIINAKDVITNEDNPVMAIRRKTDSSMVVALKTLAKEEGYDGVVSSGNTGSLLTGATLIVKLLDGVTRATLSPLIPTVDKDRYTILCDAGANVDCKPQMLEEFAVMGSVYMKNVFGIENPTVALLNNGAEEEKGNALNKEAYQLLKNNSKINFVGNVEGEDFVDGKVDVIVTDGFAGNVALKTTEGAAKSLFKMIKAEILAGGFKAKIGYLLLKSALKKVKNRLSTDEVGGAVFLGAKKVVVKAHGSSTAIPFKATILQAEKMVQTNVLGLIEEGLKKIDG